MKLNPNFLKANKKLYIIVLLLFGIFLVLYLTLNRIILYSGTMSALKRAEILNNEAVAQQETFTRYSIFMRANYNGSLVIDDTEENPQISGNVKPTGSEFLIHFKYINKPSIINLTKEFIEKENLQVSIRLTSPEGVSRESQIYQLEFLKKQDPWIRIRMQVPSKYIGIKRQKSSKTISTDGQQDYKTNRIRQNSADIIKLVIIMDDLGNQVDVFKKMIELDFDITYSIMPQRRYSQETAKIAHEAGREVIMHLPMQPENLKKFNPGRGALFISDRPEEIIGKLEINLETVPFAMGANNHMGSAFTQNSDGLDIVMRFLRSRSMFFVDSKTAPGRIAKTSAQKYQLPFLSRDIFLDNEMNEEYIKKQLMKAVKIAKKHGVAITIGHPYPVTYVTLAEYLPTLEKQGIKIIKVSEMVL